MFLIGCVRARSGRCPPDCRALRLRCLRGLCRLAVTVGIGEVRASLAVDDEKFVFRKFVADKVCMQKVRMRKLVRLKVRIAKGSYAKATFVLTCALLHRVDGNC